MSTKLSHIIEFVADMNRAVAFYRDVVGLTSEHKFWWQSSRIRRAVCLGVAGTSGPIRSCASFVMADFQSIRADARWRWLYLERQVVNAY